MCSWSELLPVSSSHLHKSIFCFLELPFWLFSVSWGATCSASRQAPTELSIERLFQSQNSEDCLTHFAYSWFCTSSFLIKLSAFVPSLDGDINISLSRFCTLDSTLFRFVSSRFKTPPFQQYVGRESGCFLSVVASEF